MAAPRHRQGATQPQANDAKTAGSHRELEGASTDTSQSLQSQPSQADTLIFDIRPPELRESIPPVLCPPFVAAPGN